MVSILPPKRNIFNAIADSMQEFGKHAPALLEERYQTQRGLGAVDELQKSLENAKGDISKILPAISKAYTLNPSLQRSGIAEHYLKMAQAANAGKTPLAGELEVGETQAPQRQELPSFMGQKDQIKEATEFFPTNIGPKEEVGNVPQEATTGKKMPLLSPDQFAPAARKLANERTKAGIPTTPLQAMEEIKEHEEDKKIHNAKIDEELSQRVAGQEKYGAKAVDYLQKAFGKAPIPPEVEAYFAKEGENVSKEGKSEAEINRYLSEKAKNFANSVSNIKQSASAPRLQNSLIKAFEGTYKNFEESAKDLQKHLKPLLDAQLYDYSRGLLSDLGYYPEEREIIVNPLTDKSKALLNSVREFPKQEKIAGSGIPGVPTRQNPLSGDKQNVKTALTELKQIEPNFSLPLARKMMEDKGYGWRTFKDALNELQDEGFTLEDDQRTQMGFLDTPAESQLEQMLRSLNLIGR